MSGIHISISELVGRTPILELTNYERNNSLCARIAVKLEYANPNQSIKDRIALAMIEDAERSGRLKPGDTIVETTSGNTGIGLAAIAAAKGYPFRVYIQENVSVERFKVIKALGGQIIRMTDVPEIAQTIIDTNGDFVAVIKVLERDVLSKEQNICFLNQIANPSNPGIHEKTTGPEIWEDTDGKVDILVATVGTGGTVTGVGRYLKAKNKNVKVVAVQPGPNSLPTPAHPDLPEITGLHAFIDVPDDHIPATLDRTVFDEALTVETADAYRAAREVAKSDGILVGTSSGAAIHAATELARRPENRGKLIVAIMPDTGLRYLSTGLFDD